MTNALCPLAACLRGCFITRQLSLSYQPSRFELPLKAGSQSASQAGARIEPRCVFLAIVYIGCCTYLHSLEFQA